MSIFSIQALKKKFDRNFLKETSGNVAIIAGLSIIPIIAVVGVAIDFQLVVTKKNTVQQTLDVTLIAAARELQAGRTRAEVQTFAEDYFDTLLAANDSELEGNCGDLTTTIPEGSEQINGVVDCIQPTVLSSVLGNDEFEFRVGSGSTFGIGQVDVAMVFDLSGSMNQNNRLNNLENAAESAFEILLNAESQSDQSVRIAIASYNHTVNAGNFYNQVVAFNQRPQTLETSEDAGDLYPENYGVVQIDQRDGRRFYDYETVRCTSGNNSNCQNYVDLAGRFYPESSSCVYARLGGDALTDRGPVAGRYVMSDQPLWDYLNNDNENNRPDEFNAKRRGQDEIEDDARGQFRDGGRNNRFNPILFSTGAGNNSIASSYGFNRSGNSSQAENNALTNHIRIRDDVPGQNARDFISNSRALSGCRDSGPLLPLTDRLSDLTSYTNNMTAGGATAGHLGIAWGWYLLSPEWNNIWPNGSEPLEYFEEETAKAMIIMTDGVFNSTHPLTPKNSNETAADYCRAIKSTTNIRIYTIGFDVPTRTETVEGVEIEVPNLPLVEGTGQNILQFCASDEETTFDATSGPELEEAYRQIAAEISDLRIAN